MIPRPGPFGTCLGRVIAVGCLPQPHSQLQILNLSFADYVQIRCSAKKKHSFLSLFVMSLNPVNINMAEKQKFA